VLNHALDLAARGFRVFPLVPNGKTPAIVQWQRYATTDSGRINAWWEGAPERNIAVATGHGLFVLDFDVKGGARGLQSLSALDMLGLPIGFRVRTASGGVHVYLRGDEVRNSVRKFENYPGLDVRGDGGYVVGPGSVVDGAAYTVI
jgi:hypothetical protein